MYPASGITAVARPKPVIGKSNANNASEGIVYSTPVTATTGPYRRWYRTDSSASGMAIATPIPTDMSTSVMCSLSRSRMSSR